MYYNLHTHTYRCHHAKGTDREYVEAAIQGGFKLLGFSDHCPQFFSLPGYYSNFRMTPQETEDYVKSVRSLQKEYASDIKILLGFEAEYYPESFDKLRKLAQSYDFDYLIMGQHFVGNEYDENDYKEHGIYGKRYLVRYVDQVIEGLQTNAFTYVAHPDIAYFGGDKAFYTEQMGRLCAYAKERNIPLEFNMLGYENKRDYPNPAFWEIAAKTGNRVVLGFDAHQPEKLQTHVLYEDCVAKLNAMGISLTPFENIKIVKP